MTETEEIAIMADFCYYNLEFANEKLHLPNDKTALLLNILFPFITFKHLDPDHVGIYIAAEEWSDERCNSLMNETFERLKSMLIPFTSDNPPNTLQVFTYENIEQILDYATRTYFNHFPVFAHIMGTKESVFEKKITLYIDEPITVPSLKESKEIIPEKKEIPKEADKQLEGKQGDEENAEGEGANIEENKEEEEKSIEELVKALSITEDEKASLLAKIQEMKEDVDHKLLERENELKEKLEDLKNKGKKKGKK